MWLCSTWPVIPSVVCFYSVSGCLTLSITKCNNAIKDLCNKNEELVWKWTCLRNFLTSSNFLEDLIDIGHIAEEFSLFCYLNLFSSLQASSFQQLYSFWNHKKLFLKIFIWNLKAWYPAVCILSSSSQHQCFGDEDSKIGWKLIKAIQNV